MYIAAPQLVTPNAQVEDNGSDREQDLMADAGMEAQRR